MLEEQSESAVRLYQRWDKEWAEETPALGTACNVEMRVQVPSTVKLTEVTTALSLCL